jgi:hypothetical protein
MKIITNSILSILFVANLGMPKHNLTMNNSQAVFEIDFQDFFINDTVDLKINQCKVLFDTVLTSEISTGFTGVTLKAFKIGHKQIEIRYGKQTIICADGGDIVQVNIVINRKEISFSVNLLSGKFIGLSKKNMRMHLL